MVITNTNGLSADLITRDSMSDTEFNTIMGKGLIQAKEDNSSLVTDVFTDLKKEIKHRCVRYGYPKIIVKNRRICYIITMGNQRARRLTL